MNEANRPSPDEREQIVSRVRQLAPLLRQLLENPGAADESLAGVLDELDQLERMLEAEDVRMLTDELSR